MPMSKYEVTISPVPDKEVDWVFWNVTELNPLCEVASKGCGG